MIKSRRRETQGERERGERERERERERDKPGRNGDRQKYRQTDRQTGKKPVRIPNPDVVEYFGTIPAFRFILHMAAGFLKTSKVFRNHRHPCVMRSISHFTIKGNRHMNTIKKNIIGNFQTHNY